MPGAPCWFQEGGGGRSHERGALVHVHDMYKGRARVASFQVLLTLSQDIFIYACPGGIAECIDHTARPRETHAERRTHAGRRESALSEGRGPCRASPSAPRLASRCPCYTQPTVILRSYENAPPWDPSWGPRGILGGWTFFYVRGAPVARRPLSTVIYTG